jgi:16S rRNA G966 N2-methylase RsmD
MKTLPSWLSGKNLYIAEKLISQGFRYCGHSNNFCQGYFIEGLEDWDLFFALGEIGLEAICDKAFFFIDLESSKSSPEEILEHAKKLISLFSYQWDHESANHQQLELFAA